MLFGFVYGLGLAVLGGALSGILGAIIGFFLGAGIAYYQSGMGKKTKPPEVQTSFAPAFQASPDDGADEAKDHLKTLFEKDLIDETEYRKKKEEILATLSPQQDLAAMKEYPEVYKGIRYRRQHDGTVAMYTPDGPRVFPKWAEFWKEVA